MVTGAGRTGPALAVLLPCHPVCRQCIGGFGDYIAAGVGGALHAVHAGRLVARVGAQVLAQATRQGFSRCRGCWAACCARWAAGGARGGAGHTSGFQQVSGLLGCMLCTLGGRWRAWWRRPHVRVSAGVRVVGLHAVHAGRQVARVVAQVLAQASGSVLLEAWAGDQAAEGQADARADIAARVAEARARDAVHAA